MKWYVVNITSGFEQKVKNTIDTQESLRRVSKKVIIPIVKKKRFLRDKLYHYSEKLFPGYVFISCGDSDADKIFSIVSSIPGVLNMSGMKDVRRFYEVVDVDDMFHVFDLISENNYREVKEIHDIKVDSRVRVTEGPFSSFQGVVLEMNKSSNKETKVKIGTSFFNSSISFIVVPISFLEPI